MPAKVMAVLKKLDGVVVKIGRKLDVSNKPTTPRKAKAAKPKAMGIRDSATRFITVNPLNAP